MSLKPSGGTFFVVATPIGHLGDISRRMCEVLSQVATLYAEDTRRTSVLLEHIGVRTPLRSLHEHNERGRIQEVLQLLQEGKDVALVSDAGTPVVSDPGASVVCAVADAGYKVCPVPGASALACALSVCGFEAKHVLFEGFLPHKGAELNKAVEKVMLHEGVVVFFESPHRVAHTLGLLAQHSPSRRVCVCRELTKMHEETVRGVLQEVAAWALNTQVQGEITVVLESPEPQEKMAPEDADVQHALKRCMQAGLSARDAVDAVAAVLQLPRRHVYQHMLLVQA
jgi:16S rRNA (cytidine1402-2'-O)-methyltransferase